MVKFCDLLQGHSILKLVVKNVVIFVILSVCLVYQLAAP